jgi:uncharacterized membrane protein
MIRSIRDTTQDLVQRSTAAFASLRGASDDRLNVGQAERVISAMAGGAIALFGLRSRSLLGICAAAVGGALVYRGLSGRCPAYAALGVDTANEHARRGGAAPEEYFRRGIHFEESIHVGRSPWDLYQFWRDFQNLPRFMSHLESVRVRDTRRSHWVAKGPAGSRVEWDAEIINDEPNALIAWRSLGDADVDNAGSVRFVPGPEGRGTDVKVVIGYLPPAGRIGSAIAQLFGEEPSAQVREDLQRFKHLMETGQEPISDWPPK